MVAAKEGKAIPAGWALDEDGQPTTDPAAALKGSIKRPQAASRGDAGADGGIAGDGVHRRSIWLRGGLFLRGTGNRPKLGQLFLVIDPSAMEGDVFAERIETLVTAMLADDGVRLPGARRYALARKAASEGLNVSDATLANAGARGRLSDDYRNPRFLVGNAARLGNTVDNCASVTPNQLASVAAY